MTENWREQIRVYADEDYRAFSSRLLPGVKNIIGVRLPVLRRIAKQIAGGDWRTALTKEDQTFEEQMLRGMVIAGADMSLDERLELTRGFVPFIGNWSVCDSFCASFRLKQGQKEQIRRLVLPYLVAEAEFSVRFGAVMLLCHFSSKEEAAQTLHWLSRATHIGYYAQMGVAWAIATCYTANPAEGERFLKSAKLPEEILKKSIRKVIESRAVSNADKEKARAILANRNMTAAK